MNSDNQFRMLNALKVMAKHKERRDNLKGISTAGLYHKELKTAKQENARRRDLRMTTRAPIIGRIKLRP